ncbi:MAG: hypothetical protein RLZZ337_540 [Bacteroidota bacterium]|jgi:hypothetical protein
MNIKQLKITLFILLSVVLLACNTTSETNKADKNSIEYTSDYICPMHCEGSGSDSAGLCPVCGMDYVENKN